MKKHSQQKKPILISLAIRHDWLFFIGVFGILSADVNYGGNYWCAFLGNMGTGGSQHYGVFLVFASNIGWRKLRTQLVVDSSPIFQLVAVAILAFGSVCLGKFVAVDCHT